MVSEERKTVVIYRKVRYFFWLNVLPFSLMGYMGYLVYVGRISFRRVPEGTEAMLWLAGGAGVLMMMLVFLTYPFAVWLRRSARKRLKKAVPDFAGERGLLHFLFGLPLMLVRVLVLLFCWLFYLLVVALIGGLGCIFVGLLGWAAYQSFIVRGGF